MTCIKCVEQIRSQLHGVPGIHDVNIDLAIGSVIVDTTLPSAEVEHLIQSTGKDAILRGIGAQGIYYNHCVLSHQ